MDTIEMTMEEVIAFINSKETKEFMVHVAIAEVRDGKSKA